MSRKHVKTNVVNLAKTGKELKVNFTMSSQWKLFHDFKSCVIHFNFNGN